MISYLIKSALCLGLLLAFYQLFLEREKMHRFNRFYLLGSVLFSFLAPLYVIYIEPTAAPELEVVSSNQIKEVTPDNSIQIGTILLTIYLSIAALLLIRFLKNIIDISLKISTNTKIRLNSAIIVLVEDKILPHTFWNYIFINASEYEENKIEEELYTHELAHVTQKHTLDILILEVLQIVFWFNPFMIWLKRAVQLNHEFLADDTVVASHHNISYYQHLLLDKAAWNNKFYLASNLNYSLTKKRLLMMKTPSSKLTIMLKKLAILPILGGTLFLFAERVKAQSKKKPIVIEVKEEQKSASRTQMKEYSKLFEKSMKAKSFKMKDIERMAYIYKKMSDKQRKSVKNVYDYIPPPPPPVKTVRGRKSPPPPPQPEKIVVRELKKVKPHKSEKHSKETKEVIRIKEVKRTKPHKEHEEEIEIEEVIEKMPNEVEEIEIIEEIVEEPEANLESNIFGDPNTSYYINNKKVSQKKARKFVKENKSKIKSVDVIKKDGKGKVMITTK